MSTTTTATTLVSSAATTALTTAFGTSSNGLNPPGRRLLARPSARNLKTPGIAVAGGRGGGIHTASTPNLNALYAAHANNNTTATAHSAISISNNTSRLAPPALSRKASLAALTTTTLTHTSLAAIPDATESYAFDTVLSDSLASRRMPPPLTPGKAAGGGDEIAVGDTVDVPGSMFGTVRFVGTVQGRKGTFAGVELHPEFASRGKNNGDVDGVSYFNTTMPGAGIFLPVVKAVRRESPFTPTTAPASGLKVANQNSTNYTPPTPSLPKFSQSVGPARAASPTGKKPRTSLPRPDSPVRRLQLTPAPRPSIATPAPRGAVRYGSPTNNTRFAQSVRGTAGDPSKPGTRAAGGVGGTERKASIGPRSASALGGTPSSFTDDETTPVGIGRTKTNGSVGSVSSLNLRMQQHRPGSRATINTTNDEEVERLRAQLDDRDRQLGEQAATLAEMESSLAEVQSLMDSQPEGLGLSRAGSGGGPVDRDTVQLRALLREKNDKIAMLTAEFDAHRADFRSTIDTLEMASTETERVYEKRIEELMQELHDLQERTADVDTVAQQLKQLEELVQELEEGLEDARRGEAEARGEVEFLRGEVERTRSELRREREKAAQVMNGANGATNGDRSSVSLSMSKELESKEDEIRGLKAIIHSLSRDSIPSGDTPDRPSSTQRQGSLKAHRARESIDSRLAREKLEREVAELRALVDNKNGREEELEREVEMLRRGSAATHRGSAMTIGSAADNRSSLRDSRGTVILARDRERDRERMEQQQQQTRSPESHKTHTRVQTLDTMPESDAYSTATETSTLWCEICETAGHDILTCTNMFGPQQPASPNQDQKQSQGQGQNGTPAKVSSPTSPTNKKTAIRGGPKHLAIPGLDDDSIKPAPLSPVKTKAPTSVPAGVRILPNPMDSGPVAGKESGVIDAGKWCALCERDGHDSVDCPFEDAF